MTILNYLFLGWPFWTIFLTAILSVHWIIKESSGFAGGAFIPLAIAVGAAGWRWSAAFPHTFSGAAWAAGAYLAVGGIYSALKYGRTLYRFKSAIQEILQNCPANTMDRLSRLEANKHNLAEEWRYKWEVEGSLVRLKWKEFPIANWWVWHPWFLFGSAFDFATNLGDWLVSAFKGFYRRLADVFAVKL